MVNGILVKNNKTFCLEKYKKKRKQLSIIFKVNA